MSEKYGDLLAQEVAKRVHAPVTSTTAVMAIPADSRIHGMKVLVTADGQQWWYDTNSVLAAGANVLVPSDSPTAGRWRTTTGGSPKLWVDEFTNPAAAAAAGLKAATATTVAPQTVLVSAMLAPGIAALLANPRNVTFTTAGVTASDAPATALITGTDIDDAVLTETVTIAQTATIAQGVKAFKTIVSIVYAAADGTGATIAIGFGAKFGLSKSAKTRGGGVAIVTEIAAGARVVTGTFVDAATSAPHGTYAPSTAPDATNDYSITYELA